MKKKEIRKRLRHMEDYMEEMERKVRCLDSILFFISTGMEYFYQTENCFEVNTIQFINDYLKTIRNVEIAGLDKVLTELKSV